MAAEWTASWRAGMPNTPADRIGSNVNGPGHCLSLYFWIAINALNILDINRN